MYERNLTDEQKMQNPQLVVMFRQNKYDEKMREVKEYYERGLTQEEIISRMLEGNTADISTNRRIICKEDIIEFFEAHPRTKEENQSQEEQENSSTETTDEETKKEEAEEYELDLDDTEVDENEAEKEETTNEKDTDNTSIKSETKDHEIKEIADEDLEDWEDQDFPMYDEEEKETMKNSIAIHGIIEKLIVRPIRGKEGKYQIISGRNRRVCGRELGMKTFSCIVRNDLIDDDEETELLLIDTNIATRKDLDIISRAKVLKRKKTILDNKNFKARLENMKQEAQGKEGTEKIIPVFENLQEEFNISRGNIQRYLRLADLSPDLQERVKENRINAKVGEQLSYIPKSKQKDISKMIMQNEKLKISETQAKKIKVMSDEKDITKEDLEGILLKTKKQEGEEIIKYKIEFSEEEIKSLTNKLLEETKEITDENIKQKILELLKFL